MQEEHPRLHPFAKVSVPNFLFAISEDLRRLGEILRVEGFPLSAEDASISADILQELNKAVDHLKASGNPYEKQAYSCPTEDDQKAIVDHVIKCVEMARAYVCE